MSARLPFSLNVDTPAENRTWGGKTLKQWVKETVGETSERGANVEELLSTAKAQAEAIQEKYDEVGAMMMSLGGTPAAFVYAEKTPDGKGVRIVADGEDVFFCEFGIGKDTVPNEFASESGVAVAPGSYSASVGGPYSRKGHWWIRRAPQQSGGYDLATLDRGTRKSDGGYKFTGVAGSHAMYNAAKTLQDTYGGELTFGK